jgi:hexosaminidase
MIPEPGSLFLFPKPYPQPHKTEAKDIGPCFLVFSGISYDIPKREEVIMVLSKMSGLLAFSCIIFFAANLLAVPPAPGSASPEVPSHNLMPVPKEIVFNEGKLMLDFGFSIALTGYTEPRQERAAVRLIRRLRTQTGIPFSLQIEKDASTAQLEISCMRPGEEIPSLGDDESYTLDIDSSRARLMAQTSVGAIRGMETFIQLVELDTDGFYVPAMRIQDEPRFPWRGILIDVCRHWIPLDVIKRNLDAMAAVKLNVLHWHLSEDQGFRIECRSFPLLHEMGSDGDFYTQEQIKEIVAYAADRGISIVPEFDMPGHTTAWFVGYPELASVAGPYRIERHYGVFDPCMDPTQEDVYAFLDTFFGEMTALFPDAYFHIGGDEVNGNHWNSNLDIEAFKIKNGMKDNHDLQAYFNKRVQALLNKHGKKMVGWDEIFHPELPKDIVIQSWRGQESLAETAKQGYQGILSHGYYLDLHYSSAEHYNIDPLDEEKSGLEEEQKLRILGGEACMWTEHVTPEIIDMRLWPRAACIAERLWSPREVKNTEDMYRRLGSVSRILEEMDLSHISSSAKMLQRLAGRHPVDSLKVLADIVEPVKHYTRHRTRDYTQMMPFNRLVDAVSSESIKARQFRIMVDEMLADAPSFKIRREEVRDWLTTWHENHKKLLPILKESALLTEIIPLSERISALAGAALEALDHIEEGQKPTSTWREKVGSLLAHPASPEHELMIMIAPAVRRLVSAASGSEN